MKKQMIKPLDSAGIGRQIKIRRKMMHLTQKDLALAADISVNYLAMLEAGRRSASRSVLTLLAKRLNVKTEELLYGSEYQSFLNYETYVKLSKTYPPKEVEEALRVASIFLEIKN